MLDRTEITDLELLIDKRGLRDVLNALTEIAYEKAEHIQTNWQDKPLAKAWERAARAINRAIGASSVS